MLMDLRGLRFAVALTLGGLPSLACTGPGDTVLEEIYPSAAELPENTLRFYLYFSEEMGRGDVMHHIRLQDEDGRHIKGAFLSSRFDLWSPDMRRLTLLFDPGRVKTGLDAHKDLGRALVPGYSYTLTLGPEFEDAKGCILSGQVFHTFTAVVADVSFPDPSDWHIDTPDARTVDPVVVHLGSTYDHLSLAYRLRITSARGELVPGRIELHEGESVWLFRPKAPWTAETYTLNIDPALEDLAGNRPGRLFDQPLDRRIEAVALKREFTINARSREMLEN